jgi:hypothetical protein
MRETTAVDFHRILAADPGIPFERASRETNDDC